MKRRIIVFVIFVFMFFPVISIHIASADGETLPKDFVTLEEAFGVDYTKDETTWYSYVDSKKIDGYYLQLDYITFSCGGGPSLFGREGIYSDTIKSSLSQKPYITLRRGEVFKGFTISGKSENVDKDGNVKGSTQITFSMENMFFGVTDDGKQYPEPYAYFTVSGSSSWNRQGKEPGKFQGSTEKIWVGPTHKNWDGATYEHYNAYYLVYYFTGKGEGDYPSTGVGGYAWFRIAGVMLGDGSGGSYAGTTQNANQNAGEDKGVSIPAAIAIGIAGVGAVIVGIAASSGGEEGTKKNKKSYKMYVQKDFGDAIRKGAEPVKVRARMAEIDENGIEHERIDLTQKISASSEDMTIENTIVIGRYLEATVFIPKEYNSNEAEITFTFSGEGGFFTNTIIFRAIDGPSLKFVDETENVGEYNVNGDNCCINVILGDNFTYSSQFMIIDCVTPPKVSDITAENPGNFNVTFEETNRQFVYKMHVKNNTNSDPDHDIFAEIKNQEFKIEVKVDNEEKPAIGYVTIKLYPEGITVQSSDIGKKNDIKYVRVQAFEKENAGDFDKKYQVCQMKFTCAFKCKDKSVIDPKDVKFKFERIKGSGGLGMDEDKEQSVAEKFKYKEEHSWNSGKYEYSFEPNSNLSEPDDGTFYMVILPGEAQYEGVKYKVEVPLRLRGSDLGAKGDWEKEYKELQRRIIQFSTPGNIDKWIAQLKTCATEPRASVDELRLVSKWILREYMDYWTIQSKKDLSEANMYNALVNVLEWTKFAGDCAFSFLMNAYAGPVADALISPAKDFITSAIGEVIAARSHGDEIDVDNFEFSKNLAAAGDNLVSNNIDLKDWRKAAATLGGYFAYCAIKNYILKLREKNESDFWGAICEAFKDMTAATLKSKAGELIGKWIKESKKFQEKIGPFITKYFKETNFDTLQKQLNDSLGLEGELRKLAGYKNDKVFETKVADVVEKYISSLAGSGFDKVREVYDSSKFVFENGYLYYCFNLDLFDAFHFGIKLNLSIIFKLMTGQFFFWLYDFFFKGVPSATSIIEKPNDPMLPPPAK